MQVMIVLHPDGMKAIVISHDAWWARKMLADLWQDGLWHEAKVQFPLLSGDPRVLAVQPPEMLSPDDAHRTSEMVKPKKRLRKKKETVLEAVPLSDPTMIHGVALAQEDDIDV